MQIDTFVIGGSNAHSVKDKWGKVVEKNFIDTPFGKSHPIYIVESETSKFALLFRHGENGYDITAPFVNYRANIYAAKKLGAKRIISWTGPGAISKDYEIGDIVIPHDILDFTKKRASTFFENKGLGFIRLNPVFCPCITSKMKKILEDKKILFKSKGIYVCTEGPRLETPAEIRFFKYAGADMVGMTLCPEAFLARELEMCYASICYITNYAENESIEYKEGELFEGTLPDDKKQLVENAVNNLPKIILELVATKDNPNCICKKSMLRYKKSKKIGDNFEEWF